MDDGEDVARNELAQHMVSGRHELEGRRQTRRRLVLVRTRATGGLQHQLVERQNALETKRLLHAVLGMEVDDVHAAKMPLGIRIDHVIRDDTRILDRGVSDSPTIAITLLGYLRKNSVALRPQVMSSTSFAPWR